MSHGYSAGIIVDKTTTPAIRHLESSLELLGVEQEIKFHVDNFNSAVGEVPEHVRNYYAGTLPERHLPR